jgi:hypothetical protein
MDIGAPASREQWLNAGSPMVPALQVEGGAYSLNHPSQAASLLGLTVEPAAEALTLAWDIDTVCEAWLECLRALPTHMLVAPTPSRGRSVRNLAINVFIPISLLEQAWTKGSFLWPGNPILGVAGDKQLEDYEATIESRLEERSALLSFAEDIKWRWSVFLMEEGSRLATASCVVDTPRGPLEFDRLLESQRLHSAQHLRQVTTFLTTSGQHVPTRFRAEALRGISLPAAIY